MRRASRIKDTAQTVLRYFQYFNLRWFRNGIAILAHGPQMHFDCLLHQLQGFISRPASRDTARQVRHVSAVTCAGGSDKTAHFVI